MQIQPYLQRIHYTGPLQVDIRTLRALHRAHLFTVPFENLDIHLKRPIVLDEQHLYDKIVNHGRGGFCYEHNGLFAAVLRQLGFQVDLLEARVGAKNWDSGKEFNHLALLVTLAERWLVDVGFGDSFLEPLHFDDDVAQTQSNGTFRVQHDGFEGQYLRQNQHGEWDAEYLFHLEPRQLEDFIPGCDFNQYSPDSHFTRQRICSLATATGRITLSDQRFIVTENDHRQEYDLDSEAEFQQHLHEQFGITLS